jgi:hypothetical protein
MTPARQRRVGVLAGGQQPVHVDAERRQRQRSDEDAEEPAADEVGEPVGAQPDAVGQDAPPQRGEQRHREPDVEASASGDDLGGADHDGRDGGGGHVAAGVGEAFGGDERGGVRRPGASEQRLERPGADRSDGDARDHRPPETAEASAERPEGEPGEHGVDDVGGGHQGERGQDLAPRGGDVDAGAQRCGVQAREGVGVERQPRPADEEHRCGERCSGGDADPPVHGRDSRTLTGPEVAALPSAGGSLSPGRAEVESLAGAASVLGGERGGDRIEG